MIKKFFAVMLCALTVLCLCAGISSAAGKVDVVFLIDTTGSMMGNISIVKKTLDDFVNHLTSNDIDARYALADFRDVTIGEETKIYDFSGSSWTSSASAVKEAIASLRVSGGGDWEETPTDALDKILTLNDFRSDAMHVAFLLTDAPAKGRANTPDLPDMEELLPRILEAGLRVFVVTPASLEEHYRNLYTKTDGEFLNINDDNYSPVMVNIAESISDVVKFGNSAPNISITNVNFPDDKFITYLMENLDQNKDGILSGSERSIFSLNIKGQGISSLKGIENFPLLTYLDCSFNSITTIDLSKNTRLRTLYCNDNHLAALDLSANTALTEIDASGQVVRAGGAALSPSAPLPYEFDLNLIKTSLGASVDIGDFVAKVYSLDVVNKDGGKVSFSVDTAAKKWYLAEPEVLISYRYKTTSSDSSKSTTSDDKASDSGRKAVTASTDTITTRPAIYETLSGDVFLRDALISALGLKSADLLDNATFVAGTALSQDEALTELQKIFGTTRTLSVDILFPSVISPTPGIAVFELSSDQIADYRGKKLNFVMIMKDSVSTSGFLASAVPDYQRGVFLDAYGSVVTGTIPANGNVYVASYMKSGAEYNPIIAEGNLDLYSDEPSTPSESVAPTTAGSKSKNLEVTLALGDVIVPPKVNISPFKQTVYVGRTISPITITVVNTLTSDYISNLDTLPSGLTLNGNTITGAISSIGEYTISYQVIDSLSMSKTIAYAYITVRGASESGTYSGYIPPSQRDSYRDTDVVQVQPMDPITGRIYDNPATISGDTVPTSGDTAPSSGDKTPVSGDTPAPASGDSPVNPTPGGDVDPYANGGGSSLNNAIGLSTAEALNSMLGRVNRGVEPQGLYYKITSNIDLSSISNWEGIGTDEHPFTGHLDGGGNTITYVNSSTALFGTVNSEGTAIQNLRVVARSTNASARFSSSAAPSDTNGGIVQKLAGGTIENCSFSGNVSAGGDDSSAGGIAGEVSGGTIKNCEVQQGSGVNAGYSAGGIAGYISGGEITDCTSNAEINAEYSGGIAGYSESQRSDINSNSFTQSDYEVGNDAVSLRLTPATQSVTDGSSIASITPASENISNLSFVVEGGYDLGLRVSGGSITGTIPDNTSAGTYTVTVTGIDAEGIRISGQVSITVTRRPGRIYPSRGNNLLDYIFDMPAGLSQGVSAFFGGESVYQFAADEIAAESWQPDTADLRAILGTDMRAILTLPAVRPARSGVYMLKLTLADVEAGVNIGLQGITAAGDISSSALEDMEYAFFDESGRKITTVPANKTVYAALKLSSGRTHRGVVTAPKELELGRISPVELDETLRSNIAESLKDTLNVSADALMSISEENILDPEEPTQEMRDEMRSRESDVVGKMNTLLVSRDGYYVLKVTLSDDLYEEHVKGVKAEELKAYVLYDNEETGSAEVSASLLGLLNTWELLTLTGNKLEFGAKEFLMVGFLNAGTPFSVYLTKLILALLMGGCDAGLGLAGLVVVAGTVILILRRRR